MDFVLRLQEANIMKKTLAVILSAVLLLCCLPFAVNAAEVIYPASGLFGASDELKSGNSYVIPEGVTIISLWAFSYCGHLKNVTGKHTL